MHHHLHIQTHFARAFNVGSLLFLTALVQLTNASVDFKLSVCAGVDPEELNDLYGEKVFPEWVNGNLHALVVIGKLKNCLWTFCK